MASDEMSIGTKVAKVEEGSALVRLAIEKGVDVAVLERIVALQEHVTDRNAETAMNEAVSKFQQECPQIAKRSKARIATKSGGSFEYKYADLSEIAHVIRPILARHGLSYTWDAESNEKTVSVTCILRHVEGATRTAKFSGPSTSNSGASDIQKVGAAVTYARRQSLVQVLGLVMADGDADGAQPMDSDHTITDVQLANLQALVDELGAKLNKPAFFKYFGVERLSEIPQARYAEAREALERKRKEATA